MCDLTQEDCNTREDFHIMGRDVGTATGWDLIDTCEIVLYDFIAAPGVPLPNGDLNFNFLLGRLYQYDDDGKETYNADMVLALSRVELAT